MSRIVPRVRECFDSLHVLGRYVLNLDVAGDGTLEHICVDGDDTQMALCIGDTAKSIILPMDGQPYSFSYPYEFR